MTSNTRRLSSNGRRLLIGCTLCGVATMPACGTAQRPTVMEPLESPELEPRVYVANGVERDLDGKDLCFQSSGHFYDILRERLSLRGVSSRVGSGGAKSIVLRPRLSVKRFREKNTWSVSAFRAGERLKVFRFDESFDKDGSTDSCDKIAERAATSIAVEVSSWIQGSSAIPAKQELNCWQTFEQQTDDAPRWVRAFPYTATDRDGDFHVGDLETGDMLPNTPDGPAFIKGSTRRFVIPRRYGNGLVGSTGNENEDTKGIAEKKFRLSFPGVEDGDILTEINHKKVEGLKLSSFDFFVPPGTPSFTITVERQRRDGFVGTTSHEIRIPLPIRPLWQVEKVASVLEKDWVGGSQILGIADLGAAGTPAVLFAHKLGIAAIDLRTGCSRSITPFVQPEDRVKLTGFRRISPNQVVFQYKADDQRTMFAPFRPESATEPFGTWTQLNIDSRDNPCYFRDECLLDVDGDGVKEELSLFGVPLGEKGLDFSNPQELQAWSFKTGKMIYQRRFRQEIMGSPFISTLTKAKIGGSVPVWPWHVNFDAVGDGASEWVSLDRGHFYGPSGEHNYEPGFRIRSAGGAPPIRLIGFEVPHFLDASNFGVESPTPGRRYWSVHDQFESMTAADMDHDGTVRLLVLRRVSIKLTADPANFDNVSSMDGDTRSYLQLLVIRVAKKSKIEWALEQGTPDFRWDAASRARYVADPVKYFAELGPQGK